jgi:hypothetical protein
MALVALTLSLVVAVLGAVGIVVPTVLLAISRPFLTPTGLYAAAALRLVLGTVLFVAAPTSRAPKIIRILGVVIIVAGLATPLIGVERARAIVEWWAAQGSALLRVWAGIALVFGLFLAYAVAPRRPRPDPV